MHGHGAENRSRAPICAYCASSSHQTKDWSMMNQNGNATVNPNTKQNYQATMQQPTRTVPPELTRRYNYKCPACIIWTRVKLKTGSWLLDAFFYMLKGSSSSCPQSAASRIVHLIFSLCAVRVHSFSIQIHKDKWCKIWNYKWTGENK